MPRGVYTRTKPPWNKGLTKETDERISKAEETKKQTVQRKYGVDNVFQSKEVLDKISDDRHSGKLAQKAMDTKEQRYGDRNYNNMTKTKQTKFDRYGDETYNNMEQNYRTCLDKYGVEYHNQNPELGQKISQSRIANDSWGKAQQTIIAKYGSMEKYYSESACKRYETMQQNGTLFSKESKLETEYYKYLCEEYGEQDIRKQYRDGERYPFKCDFYIVSQDKFIELNGFFTHGPHPFDKTNEEDLKLAVQLEDRNTEWSKNILYVWTDLDVRKLETARKNKLNFEAIYWYNDNSIKLKDGKDIV